MKRMLIVLSALVVVVAASYDIATPKRTVSAEKCTTCCTERCGDTCCANACSGC
jgi:hypothetical protein